jgi:NADH-quinone oxidoreductase subunit K
MFTESRINSIDIKITLAHYLFLSASIFTLGVFGIFVNRKNVIVILMSIELILLSVNINMVAFSVYLQNITGQIFTLFILTVAAAEAAIGLAILVVFFRNRGSIQVEDINSMKG